MIRLTTAMMLASLTLLTPAAAADPAQGVAAAPSTPAVLPFFLFSDTQVSYAYLANVHYPGIMGGKAGFSKAGRSVPVNVMTLTHANAWAYGTNFLNLDVSRSGSQNPATNPPPQREVYDYGATAVAFTYRGTLSGNALTQTQIFALPGLIKDVSLTYGVDHSTSDMSGWPMMSRVLGGLNFAFDVPAGFFNVSLLAQKDWLRQADLPAPFRDTAADVVPRVEAAFTLPLTFVDLPLALTGSAAYTAPRGSNPYYGNFKAEFISRTNLVLDVGALVYKQPNRLKAFAGFLYARNGGGYDPRVFPGTEVKSFLTGMSFTLF